MNEELFQSPEALTFDDVLVVPGYTEVLPDQTKVSTQLTPKITLGIPVVSAAMDTVTEARMAVVMAQQGGIGILHRFMSIEKQAEFLGVGLEAMARVIHWGRIELEDLTPRLEEPPVRNTRRPRQGRPPRQTPQDVSSLFPSRPLILAF